MSAGRDRFDEKKEIIHLLQHGTLTLEGAEILIGVVMAKDHRLVAALGKDLAREVLLDALGGEDRAKALLSHLEDNVIKGTFGFLVTALQRRLIDEQRRRQRRRVDPRGADDLDGGIVVFHEFPPEHIPGLVKKSIDEATSYLSVAYRLAKMHPPPAAVRGIVSSRGLEALGRTIDHADQRSRFLGFHNKRGPDRPRWAPGAKRRDNECRAWQAKFYAYEGPTGHTEVDEEPVEHPDRGTFQAHLSTFRKTYASLAATASRVVARAEEINRVVGSTRPSVVREWEATQHPTLRSNRAAAEENRPE